MLLLQSAGKPGGRGGFVSFATFFDGTELAGRIARNFFEFFSGGFPRPNVVCIA